MKVIKRNLNEAAINLNMAGKVLYNKAKSKIKKTVKKTNIIRNFVP
jgi:hypothetical protein